MKHQVDPGKLDVDEPSAQVFEFGLHPNPARDMASVQVESGFGTQISLYSPTGALISNQLVLSQVTRLDLRDLASGVYLVEVVKSDGARAAQRLTVVN